MTAGLDCPSETSPSLDVIIATPFIYVTDEDPSRRRTSRHGCALIKAFRCFNDHLATVNKSCIRRGLRCRHLRAYIICILIAGSIINPQWFYSPLIYLTDPAWPYILTFPTASTFTEFVVAYISSACRSTFN